LFLKKAKHVSILSRLLQEDLSPFRETTLNILCPDSPDIKQARFVRAPPSKPAMHAPALLSLAVKILEG